MKCPVCLNNKTSPSDTRNSCKRGIFGMTRTRTCKRCGHRFYTFEIEWSEHVLTDRQIQAVKRKMDMLMETVKEMDEIIKNSEPKKGRKR
jgi:transcriptional regulator NrdR family protein